MCDLYHQQQHSRNSKSCTSASRFRPCRLPSCYLALGLVHTVRFFLIATAIWILLIIAYIGSWWCCHSCTVWTLLLIPVQPICCEKKNRCCNQKKMHSVNGPLDYNRNGYAHLHPVFTKPAKPPDLDTVPFSDIEYISCQAFLVDEHIMFKVSILIMLMINSGSVHI